MIQEGKHRKNEVVILILILIIIIIIIVTIIIIMISITVIKKHPCLRHSIRYAYAFINILPD